MTDAGRASAAVSKDRWMVYIEAEVDALCRSRGWRHQIRRAWTCRAKAIAASDIDDYEWKLMPPTDYPPEDELVGYYYVLSLDTARQTFVLLHDNYRNPLGDFAVRGYDSQSSTTSTAINVATWDEDLPPAGYLTAALDELTQRFRPNLFCYS